jgi:hypothetical protein
LTIYTYYGQEQVNDKVSFVSGGKGVGYGSSLNNNAGSSTYGGTVNGNVKRVSQVTIGEWWKFYQGNFGRMQAGLQYSYTNDKYFAAVGGAPNASDNMIFTSLRYYWQ